MPNDGLTQTQIDFIEKYLKLPKIGSGRKTRDRRDTATREFKRFNVNSEAVGRRIDEMSDPTMQSMLRGELARAEKLIGDNAKDLHFEEAMSRLAEINQVVRDHHRQAEVRQKHALMIARMDVVENSPALDNIDDITRVWAFADATFDSGIKSNNIKKLAEADKALDQLRDLIDAGRPDITGAGRESKAKLRDVAERLAAARTLADDMFEANHVPPALTAKFKTVQDRLETGAAADVATLPAAATAAETAMADADTTARALYDARRAWLADHARFRVRYDLLDAHALASEATYVKPKFDTVRSAYKAAADHALAHDYARATTDLAPVFAQVDAALKFADDYQNFQALHAKRKAMVDALPDPAGQSYDQVKSAITDAVALLHDAGSERDAGNMAAALQKLTEIPAKCERARKLVFFEEEYTSDSATLTKRLHQMNGLPAPTKALMQTELTYMADRLVEAKALADGGNIDRASVMLDKLYSFERGLNKRPEPGEEVEVPSRVVKIEAFLKAKQLFETNLAEVRALTDPDGKVAITGYLAQMNEAKTRLDKWETEGAVDTALAVANQLADLHKGKMDDAEEAKSYLENKTNIESDISQLESGAAGADASAETVAIVRQMMANALAMTQKDDWFQAARMMQSAAAMVVTAFDIGKASNTLSLGLDAGKLGNVAADFDGAYGEFEKVLNTVSGLDTGNAFGDRLNAIETSAKQARSLLPGDAAGARAALDSAIEACRAVLVSIHQSKAYDTLAQSTKASLSEIKKSDKKGLLKVETDAIQTHLDTAKGAASPGQDFKTALDELSKAQNEVKTAFGMTPSLSYYLDTLKDLEKVQAKLKKKDVAPGLVQENARFDALINDFKAAFANRRAAELEQLGAKATDLAISFQLQGQHYKEAQERYQKLKALMGPEMSHPGAKVPADEVRKITTEIDRALSDHLYDMAYYMCQDATYKVNRAKADAAAYDAMRPVKDAAIQALQALEDRDDPANGAAHAQIVALRAAFDAALDKENLRNFSGVTRVLTGFPERCQAVEPLLDAFDLYVAARDEAQTAVANLKARDTAPIAPLFARIEGKRDNALRLAGTHDFDTAMDLFRELLDDCQTAEATLQRTAVFGQVMDKVKDVAKDDTPALKKSVATAKATLAVLRSRPAALFVKAALNDISGRLDTAEATADTDFDGALALVTSAVSDCALQAAEMGKFDQLADTAEQARKLIASLSEAHPQRDFTLAEVTALGARVDTGMTSVRADPTRRPRVRDDLETVIATCRDLRHVLDAHQVWHLERRQAELDLRALEQDENRHMIGADMRACQQAIDASATKAQARDHAGAMKDLRLAADLMVKARLRIKACTNEAPDKAELEKLLAAENGSAMLDDVIKGLDEDAQRKVMNVAFEARFGCKLDIFKSPKDYGKGRKDKDLGKKAPNIKRFFDLMSGLPTSSTLDNDSMLIFSHVGEEAMGSYYNGGSKEVAMREGESDAISSYGMGLEHELGVDPATLELQEGEPIDFFSWNTLHEVGHAVDDKLGFMKSHGNSLAGWEVFGANVRPVADAIAGDLTFDSKYIAEYISSGRNSRPPVPEPSGCLPEEWERRRREACAWVDRVRVGNDPWSSDSTAAMSRTASGKVFHESYDNDWCCYDYSARAKGVSGYQFRAPGEWFSELYAAVHSKKLKNSHTHYDIISNAR